MGNVNYIFFDMDGTLIDSKPGIVDSVHHTIAVLGLESKPDEMLEKFAGPPLVESFMDIFHMSEDEARQAAKIFRSYYSDKGILNASLYPGIKKVLHTLKQDYQMFVATSKPTEYAKRVADELGISGYFVEIAGSNLDNTRSKKAEVIQYLLETYQIEERDQIVMVGDKAQDVIGARKCGIDTLGVLYGYGSEAELLDAGAEAIVSTVEDITAYFSN